MEKLRDDGKSGNVSCPVTHCSWCSKRGKVRQPLDLEPAWSIHRCPWALWFYDVCKLNWLTFPIEFMLHYLGVWEYSFTGTTFLNVKKAPQTAQSSHMTGAAVNDASKNMASDAWHDPPVHWWVGENIYIYINKCQKGQIGQRFWRCCFTTSWTIRRLDWDWNTSMFFRSPFWIFWPRGPWYQVESVIGGYTMGRLSKIFHESPTRHLAFAVCFEECENLKAVLRYD